MSNHIHLDAARSPMHMTITRRGAPRGAAVRSAVLVADPDPIVDLAFPVRGAGGASVDRRAGGRPRRAAADGGRGVRASANGEVAQPSIGRAGVSAAMSIVASPSTIRMACSCEPEPAFLASLATHVHRASGVPISSLEIAANRARWAASRARVPSLPTGSWQPATSIFQRSSTSLEGARKNSNATGSSTLVIVDDDGMPPRPGGRGMAAPLVVVRTAASVEEARGGPASWVKGGAA